MNTEKKYKVALTAHGNIDHGANPYAMVAPPQIVFADTIEELQQAVEDYIEEYDLGGGNWTGGQVSETATGKKVGYISYNCRYWEETAKWDDEE